MTASQGIAEGRHDEGGGVPGDTEPGELDELAQPALSSSQVTDCLEQPEAPGTPSRFDKTL